MSVASPKAIVIDPSMALAWLFERQTPADQQRANHLLEACGQSPWWVPGLWHLEVRNALLVAERSTRILGLARAHRLSSYDATYLELAQRLGASLASFDRDLNQAAAGVAVALVEAP